jgi:predicted transcriptional regulator
MPVGLVNDDDFLKEMNKLSGRKTEKESHPIIPEIVELDHKGRKEGDNNVPDALRQIIGEDATINGRQSALGIARMFGISDSSVSAYAKGSTSTSSYDSPSPTIKNHIIRARQRASKKAGAVLTRALGAITQEKLDYTDAKDLSVIAKNMSAIVKDLEPPSSDKPADENKQPQFVIFAPQFRDERSFDTIHVQE